jgi:hypothetical protein
MNSFTKLQHSFLLNTLGFLCLAANLSIAQSTVQFTNENAFKAQVENPVYQNFEGLIGNGYNLEPGRGLHFNNSSSGINLNGIRYVGETVGHGYETWLTTHNDRAGDGSGAYNFNGSVNLMGGRHRLHVYPPVGTKAVGMWVACSKTGGDVPLDIYVKLRSQTNGQQFANEKLRTREQFIGFIATEDIEYVDFFPHYQTNLPPYIVIDHVTTGGATPPIYAQQASKVASNADRDKFVKEVKEPKADANRSPAFSGARNVEIGTSEQFDRERYNQKADQELGVGKGGKSGGSGKSGSGKSGSSGKSNNK